MTKTLLTVEQARTLANDLVAHLGTMPTDSDAVSDTLARWAAELGPHRMGQVCMAAVQLTFADCLTWIRRDEWPEAGLTITLPERTLA